MATKKVEVRHDESGQTALVNAVQVKGLTKHGWTVVDDGIKEEAANDAAPQTPEAPASDVNEER